MAAVAVCGEGDIGVKGVKRGVYKGWKNIIGATNSE